jgi:methylthioribose-1-phosphate isomerase
MPSSVPPPAVETLRWIGDAQGHLRLIDQTRLPVELVEIDCRAVETVWEAIRSLRVRGAPAIGVAAAYGVCLGIQGAAGGGQQQFFARLKEVADYLAGARPTAVNLFWALERMTCKAESLRGRPVVEVAAALLDEARAIHEEDRQCCRAIGRHGAPLLEGVRGVLTHCNAGGLATGGDGTALGVIFAAVASGAALHVFADETRPLLQGARLTAWELRQRGIPATLICDSAAGMVMRQGKVQAVVTGADRIAANGDAANKIGTYALAVLARAHEIPFYVAAPASTFDLSLASGAEIPIEQRDPREITHGFGLPTAPEGIDAYNPAFDVTPAELITAIVCERGVIRPVGPERIAAVLGRSGGTPGTK